jgi:hypothetical protein
MRASTPNPRAVGPAPNVGSPNGEPVDPDMTNPDGVQRDDRHLPDGGDVGQVQSSPVGLACVGVDGDPTLR